MKTLTLLFLSLLCTCVSAQKSASSELRGSGSMIVNIGDEIWEASISSETLHETHQFVSENRYRENPRGYPGYEVVNASERHDLRMIHKLVNERLAAGWQLLSTKHSMGTAVLDYNQLVRPEIIYYAFSVPTSSISVGGKTEGVVVKTARVSDADPTKLRGNILRNADSTFTLLIEEKVGETWLEYYRLQNAGMMAGDAPSLIESITISRKQIIFTVKLNTGYYQYHFSRWQDDHYFLSYLSFNPENKCGLKQFHANISSGILAICTGEFVRQECMPGDKLITLEERVEIRQAWLHTFIPGTRRFKLKNRIVNVFY
ncbi:MAG: hypothetical protein AB8H12_10625 [Lewinella sp.]